MDYRSCILIAVYIVFCSIKGETKQYLFCKKPYVSSEERPTAPPGTANEPQKQRQGSKSTKDHCCGGKESASDVTTCCVGKKVLDSQHCCPWDEKPNRDMKTPCQCSKISSELENAREQVKERMEKITELERKLNIIRESSAALWRFHEAKSEAMEMLMSNANDETLRNDDLEKVFKTYECIENKFLNDVVRTADSNFRRLTELVSRYTTLETLENELSDIKDLQNCYPKDEEEPPKFGLSNIEFHTGDIDAGTKKAIKDANEKAKAQKEEHKTRYYAAHCILGPLLNGKMTLSWLQDVIGQQRNDAEENDAIDETNDDGISRHRISTSGDERCRSDNWSTTLGNIANYIDDAHKVLNNTHGGNLCKNYWKIPPGENER